MFKIGSLSCAAIAAVMTGFATPPALAQQAQTVGFDLFTGYSVDLNPDAAGKLVDAARKAQAPGDCPFGRITIFTAEGDPLFQEALAAARRDAVLQYLNGQGIDVSRFFVDSKVFGTEGSRLDTNFRALRDNDPPKLTVTSTPEKGKKVTPNQRITVKAIARDDVGSWQSGIKTIDLEAEGGQPFGFEDYPQSCDNPPPPRTLDGVYIVPANPPPIVRLRAVARDYAGNQADLWAEFPTGDWYGWVEWSETLLNVPSRKPTRFWGRLDFTADYDGRGNITGRLVGIENFEGSELEGPPCDINTTKPTNLEVPLLGSYTPGRNTILLSIDPANAKFEVGQIGISCSSPSQKFGRMDPVIRPELNEILRDLRLTDGRHAEATREWNPASNGIGKLRMTVTLQHVQN